MNQAKISVLVPVYGVERYIAQCAESLFLQTYEDIEYIFVDDCTPDDSIGVLNSVLERFPQRQQQVTILHHEQNKGLGAARLTALQAATGDYVMHVDSDDALPTDAVTLLIEKARATNSDITDGGYAMMCNGQLTKRYMPFEGSKTKFLKLLLCQNIVLSMVWARLYKRDLYTRYQIMPVPGIDYAEDLAIMPRLYFHASRSVVQAVVYHYRDDSAASFTNVTMKDKTKRSYLQANAQVFRFYEEHDPQGNFRYPLELGYISVLRMARRNQIPMKQVDEVCAFRPQHLSTRLVATVMRSSCPLGIASLLYRCVRKAYTSLSFEH